MIPSPLLRAVGRVARRLRAQRAADAATTVGLAGLGVAALALLAGKTGALGDREARVLLVIAVVMPCVAALIAALRPVPRLVAARLLDRTHATKGRLAAALELASSDEKSEWTRAALEDAAAASASLRPDRAVPFRAPRDLASFAGLSVAVALLASLEIPRRVEIPIARGITPVVLHDDDLDAFEDRMRAITDAPDVAPEVLAQADALNRVLEDLADRRIDRSETLRRLAELEERIEAARPAGDEHLRDELRAMGQELRRSELAQDLAEAMREGDAARAELAMRELASRMREDRPDRAELDRLRRALEEAAREREDAGEDELERREEEMQRLLQREQAATPEQQQEQQRLLEQRRRELDRLRREHQERQEARRELDRLRRELEQSAESMQQQDEQSQQQTSDSMERAAEDLNRMARQQLTQEQMEDIARQARELRELIRRQREQQQQAGGQGEGQQGSQGQGGEGQQGRQSSPMDRFVLRARGQGGGQGTPIVAPGSGAEGRQGQSAGGGSQQGAQGGAGAGAQGEGQEGGSSGGRGEEQEALAVGQGGDAQLEIPGLGGQQGEEGGAGGQGEGTMPGGGAGAEHAPASLDDPTGLREGGRTVQVRGEARRGPSRPEVIRTAAQRGFATREYSDVYGEYADHAEEVIERDRVPPGYRFYVQRYFQLIRPRDGLQPSDSESE
ncbi:hypothetical protein [Sandaracinus amylolyticus]|uniref:Uncharacterized protein n=1 Tax=Sandaracinus amylolyticus TaxID=927083 RepID=A0A0F6W394_9BACT|nr:hypothetical protein [Sandaracinus amylolyticus]AKF06305.1 hypothetical protein DB32_003454 [Sandaracinus amylolyticus]